jgi:hypothetical protein
MEFAAPELTARGDAKLARTGFGNFLRCNPSLALQACGPKTADASLGFVG